MFKSLRVSLTLLFVVLTVVPVAIAGTLISSRGFDTLQQESVRFQHQIAQQIALSLSAFFNERLNELQVLTDVYGFGSLKTPDQKAALLALLSKQPAYYQLTLAKATGESTIRLTRGEASVNNDAVSFADDALFQNAMQTNKVSLSQVHFDEAARDRLVTIAVPIQDLFSGTTSSVLVAEVRFQDIEEAVLRTYNPTGNDDVFVVDPDGTIVAHRNPSLVIKGTVFNLPKTEGRAVGLTGNDLIVAMENLQLENLSLIVVAGTTYAQATEMATNSTQIAGLIVLATLLVTGVIVVITVSRVVNPIVKLSQVAEAIRDGDLNAKAEVNRSDEIGKMAQTFNSMTARLRQSLQGLQDHVAELEKARIEREKLIKDLQAAKRLAEENSRLKSEFLSTMSHELRTPLNAIEGFTGIILNKIGGTDYNPKTESYLTRIRSNSKRLLQLINDFLDLSRVEAGRLELANQPFSPEQLAKRWQDEISVLAEKKGLQFDVSLDSSLPPVVYGDEEALSKIVINMLSNAIKFTEKGQVKLALERDDSSWGITVEDTGIGIPPHAREFIFEEFRQVDQSSKRKYGGTGLGLAIAQKYTRAMGGTVNVKSELGKGSTFTVSLPLKTTP